jgi:regulatory protein
MAPTVTRLRHERPGWVAVELDGVRWRTLPAEAVLRAGLAPGIELDRRRAATVARERRRLRALGAAGKALARRELTRAELAERLQRGNLAPRDRDAALDAVARAGLQDDGRVARARAEQLAARGYGDLAIRADLERRGLSGDDVAASLAELAPESLRAARFVAQSGGGVRAARALARRGFADETIAALVADSAESG